MSPPALIAPQLTAAWTTDGQGTHISAHNNNEALKCRIVGVANAELALATSFGGFSAINVITTGLSRLAGWSMAGSSQRPIPMKLPSYRGYRFPAAIIQHSVWLYLRFTLSFRDF